MVVLVAAVSLREANAQRTSLVTRPSRAGGVGAIQLPDRQRQRRTLAGAVVSVTPWRPGELSGWWLVELAGAGAVGARSFVVSAAAREHVPLREREAITATIDCGRGGWHFVCDGAVATAAGELLFASSGSGSDGVASGWRLVGHAGRGVADGDRSLHPLEFEHAGGRTTTRVRGWTSVRAPDGEWLVSGRFSAWRSRRVRVPEAVDYTSYSITRIRPVAASLGAHGSADS